ncbi:MAG: M48 family metallopeptidase [Tenericutes bacterium]|nr:M48 family metallopeptidase [Mycoplasmatota bacterium]
MELTIRIITYAIIVLSYGFSLWMSILNYKNRNADIPEEVNDIYDTEAYEKWHAYYMKNFRFGLLTRTINTVLFILLLAVGYFPFINKIAENSSSSQQLQVLIFIGLYYVISYVIGIFTSYYSTFTIEEEFGFNKATKSTFVKDKIRGLILTIMLGGGILMGFTALYFEVREMFFVYGMLSSIVFIFLSSILYVKLIVPMFNKLKPLEESTLKTKIEDFAKSVGYEIKKISIMDASKRSTKLNAYFTGFGRFKQVVLYDTLVEKCSEEEVVAVLAHEIGHNKHKHMWTGLIESILMVALYLGLLLLLLENPVFSKAFGFTETNFGFAVILFTVLITPIMIPISFLSAYISRKHEYQADHYAASHYSKEHMESSLKVLTRENFSNLTPHPLFVQMNYSHPPTVSRIRAIRKIEKK